MGKSAATALTYELGSKPRTGSVGRVSRPWAIQGELKHLDRLSTLRIALYVIKRHQFGLVITLCVLGWAVAFSGWIAA